MLEIKLQKKKKTPEIITLTLKIGLIQLYVTREINETFDSGYFSGMSGIGGILDPTKNRNSFLLFVGCCCCSTTDTESNTGSEISVASILFSFIFKNLWKVVDDI